MISQPHHVKQASSRTKTGRGDISLARSTRRLEAGLVPITTHLLYNPGELLPWFTTVIQNWKWNTNVRDLRLSVNHSVSPAKNGWNILFFFFDESGHMHKLRVRASQLKLGIYTTHPL